jgi:GNAT superfamily N-acetyltransferase
VTTSTVRPLDPSTYPAFEDLVERHGGVWGGCWCMAFHAEGGVRVESVQARHDQKTARVTAGTTHAALVLDGERCIGWAQFGPPPELPRIKHRRQYEAEAGEDGAPPDWRITCFFVDREHRGQGVAGRALVGAVAQIAALGGGIVESFPQEVSTRTSAGFIHNATLSLFERHGFARIRRLGKANWLVRRTVEPA